MTGMVSLDDLREKVPSKFSLVMLAAKRARQIKDGAPRLVDTESVNPVTIALEEIAADKLVLDGMVAHVVDDFPRVASSREREAELEELLALVGRDVLEAGGPEEVEPVSGRLAGAAALLGSLDEDEEPKE